MSQVDVRIKQLADAAVDIAMIANPDIRHKGGFWLNGELDDLFSNHLFTEDQRLDFMAVVKIMLDVIFRDAVEDTSDLAPMDLGATSLAGMVRIAEEGVAEIDRKAWEESD